MAEPRIGVVPAQLRARPAGQRHIRAVLNRRPVPTARDLPQVMLGSVSNLLTGVRRKDTYYATE